MIVKHKYNYNWTLEETKFTKDKGTVFSCFACGGGSTMGYKLAGFDVIGMNEIDFKMAECYITNHKPKYSYIEDIRTFRLRDDLPDELFNLDILDGSPPCSSFSMAGNREKDWGKEKRFREGQKKQILDDLFFEFIALGKRLQSKIIIAENVKGLIMGEARKYVKEIGLAFDDAGYYVIKELLNASNMGVPQRRERVFFIAMRKDLVDNFDTCQDMFNSMPELNLWFNEKEILFEEFRSEIGVNYDETERGNLMKHRIKTDNTINDINQRLYNKTSGFNAAIVHDNKICQTITSSERAYRYYDGHGLSIKDYINISSFPQDYNFIKGTVDAAKYIVGMSVPPVMMTQIASRISEQWLNVLDEKELITA